MNDKLKVLYLHTELNLSCGITKTIFLLSKETSKEFDAIVFTLGGDAISKFLLNNIKVATFRKNYRTIWHTLLILFDLFLLTKRNNINIIHSHHRYFDLLAFMLSKVVKVKTITSVQSKVTGNKQFSYNAKHLIACSHAIKNHLINYFKIEKSKISVIHNFVDVEECNMTDYSTQFKQEIVGDNNALVIGFIGRINIPEKGIDILLETFYKFSLELENVALLMVGNGTDLDYVNQYVKTRKINVVLVNAKENVFPYLAIMDIVVMPSRVEPFGIVAIEAGVMKKAVVASDVDGLKEIIEDGIDGILVKGFKSDCYLKQLIHLSMDESLRLKLGKSLNNKVFQNFTVQQAIPKYISIYKTI